MVRFSRYSKSNIDILYNNFIHFKLAVLQHADAIGEQLVDKVIELSHFNFNQRFLLSLFFAATDSTCLSAGAIRQSNTRNFTHFRFTARFRAFFMLYRSLMLVRGATFSIVFLSSALFIILENAFVTSSCFNCVCFSVLFAMYPHIRKWVKADCTVYLYQPHSVVQIEAEQLLKHNVVLLWKK